MRGSGSWLTESLHGETLCSSVTDAAKPRHGMFIQVPGAVATKLDDSRACFGFPINLKFGQFLRASFSSSIGCPSFATLLHLHPLQCICYLSSTNLLHSLATPPLDLSISIQQDPDHYHNSFDISG